MPKVSKKDARTPLQEVAPVPMESNTDTAEPAGPSKPQFAPLSAYEQNGKKIEFRRVCSHGAAPLVPAGSRLLSCLQLRVLSGLAGYGTTA